MTSLTDKVSSVLSQDPPKGEDSALDGLRVYPRHSDGLSEFEFDCRDWGFVFGVAYGVARSENPFEPNDELIERALLAARDAYARWGGAKIFTSEAYDEDRAGRGAKAVVA